MHVARSLRLALLILAFGLSACAASAPAPGPEYGVERFRALDAALLASGRMKADRLARDVPLTPEILAENFSKTAFGEEFALAHGVTIPIANRPSGNLRKWTGPVRYELSDRATIRDEKEVTGLVTRLRRSTGLDIGPAGRAKPNMFIRVLSEQDRARIAYTFATLEQPSPLAELFLTWAAAPEWPCAGEIYFSGPDSDTRFEIALAMIYIRDEVRGLSRQACIEEEISQSLGLVRDDPTVRPSIFNDDEEYALLTRHDELLLKILYDPELAPGMDLETAMPIVRRVARKVIE
ncbi:MAG: DUF2927 domain-containing protein [Pseudomonadota bacterium]